MKTPAVASRLLDRTILRRLAYYPRAATALCYARNQLPVLATLQAVADHIGMSPAAFSRYFSEKIGLTFSKTLRVLRIELALDHLERDESSTELLATRSGYSSCYTFTRAFKSVLGETPSEYRRRLLP